MSKETTPTPEMDAFERDIIACIPEELHQLQAYARKGRELETRLAAALAELAAMRNGEVVAWMHEGSSREGPMAFVTPGTYASLKEKSPYTIPLYRSPAPDAVVEEAPPMKEGE